MNAQRALQECAEIQKLKQQDYTSGTNRMENFERSSFIASWFKNDEDKSFAVLIGTKLARLASLLNKNNNRDSKPNFESIEDTFKDAINYFALWGENSCPDYTSGSINYDDHNTHMEAVRNYINSNTIAERPLEDKKSIITPKEKKMHELINMYDSLNEEDYRILLSKARELVRQK